MGWVVEEQVLEKLEALGSSLSSDSSAAWPWAAPSPLGHRGELWTFLSDHFWSTGAEQEAWLPDQQGVEAGGEGLVCGSRRSRMASQPASPWAFSPRPWQSSRPSSRRQPRHRSWPQASGMQLRPGSGSGPSCRRWERRPASLVS